MRRGRFLDQERRLASRGHPAVTLLSFTLLLHSQDLTARSRSDSLLAIFDVTILKTTLNGSMRNCRLKIGLQFLLKIFFVHLDSFEFHDIICDLFEHLLHVDDRVGECWYCLIL